MITLRHRSARAFSLVEVLIVTAIFGLIIAGLTDLLVRYSIMITAQEAHVEVETSADAIVREAHAAVSSAGRIVSAHTFSGTSFTTGSTTLVLELPAVDSTGSLIGSFDYIAFYASGTEAFRTTDAALGSTRLPGAKRLSTSLANLTFTYPTIDPSQATSTIINVRTRAETRGTIEEQHLTEHAYLRNL